MSDLTHYTFTGEAAEAVNAICAAHERERAAVERERDRYKAALERVANHIEGADALGAGRVYFIRGIIREALAPSEAEQAAAEAAGPEPDFPAPSVADYPGLGEDGPPNPENPELDGDEGYPPAKHEAAQREGEVTE